MDVVFGRGDLEPLCQLVDGFCVRQTFQADGPVLESAHFFANYLARSDNASVALTLLEGPGRAVAGTWRVDAADMPGAGWLGFRTACGVVPGRGYELMLCTENCRAGFSPVFFCGLATRKGYLFSGSKLRRGMELACRLVYGDG